MKICWDNLERIRITSRGNLAVNNDMYIEMDSCIYCGEPYLAAQRSRSGKNIAEFCSKSCGKMNHIVTTGARYKISKTRKLKKLATGSNNPMFGKKHSLESINKIAESLVGKYSGKNSHNYGRKLSKKTRDKISNSRKGQLCGSDNPNWKGGVSCEPYCFEWSFEEFKDYIKERDGNRCLNPDCWKTSNKLCVHHINYNKKDCEPNNLITLCNSCNSKANKDRGWHKFWYKAIIYRRYGGSQKCLNLRSLF